MASYIKVEAPFTIFDGAELTFKAPCDCTQATGLKVYYEKDGETTSTIFEITDAHGESVGGQYELFKSGAMVKVILDVDDSKAFVQNGSTSAYLESKPSGGATSLKDLGVNASATELNYVKGVTGDIQTQINGKASSSHSHTGYASSGHSHTEYSKTDHTHDSYAAKSHSHTGYASSGHTHTTYADKDHSHSGYASSGHSHNNYMTASNPSGTGKLAMNGNTASGDYSTALGKDTVASKYGTLATGRYTVADTAYGTALGKYNKEGSNGYLVVGNGTGTGARDNAFRVGTDDKIYGVGTYNSSGADLAEMFEWLDGNPNNEDRRGLFVALDGEKIRLATPDDEIWGIVSAVPTVLGDSASENWHGRFKKDVFGANIWEPVEVEEEVDDEGNVIPAHVEMRKILNPDYDPNCEYVSREERKEWDAIGFIGKLIMVDDGTCEVNGYCTATDGGKATKSDVKTNYRVLSRIDETHIKVFAR